MRLPSLVERKTAVSPQVSAECLQMTRKLWGFKVALGPETVLHRDPVLIKGGSTLAVLSPQIPRRLPADREAEPEAKLEAGPAAAEAVTHQTLTFRKSSPCAQTWRLSPRHTGLPPEQVLGRPQPSLPKSPRPRGNHLPANWTSPPRDSAVGSAAALP